MGHSSIEQYIAAIEYKSLRGRRLQLPAKHHNAKNDILLLYGQHASLERMSGIAQVLRNYGRVTVPDLPGFGGMGSFYTIHQKPNLDNLADYLSDFIKRTYKTDVPIVIVAMSFSFLVVTRMLQMHPELVPRVKLLVSFAGFIHHDDFHVPKPLYWLWRTAATLCENRFGSLVCTRVLLAPPLIRAAYTIAAKSHPKMKDASPQERKKRIDFEIRLWHINDFQTRMHTLKIMLTADLSQHQVMLPVYHIGVAHDFYFDNVLVEQHMRTVYADFTLITAAVEAHAPTIISTAEEADPFIPKALRDLLS